MVKIPNIKIPSVRVGSIVPTSNIGVGGATPAPPTPITYLTQWKIVGNSEVHGNEIWSCGEYNPIDGKWHILVQPQGGSVADIALTEPLRKVNDVADTIEFPSETEGKALVTRNITSYNLSNVASWTRWNTSVGKRLVSSDVVIIDGVLPRYNANVAKCLCAIYETDSWNNQNNNVKCIAISNIGQVGIYDPDYAEDETSDAYIAHIQGIEILYLLLTPTTELVDAPQIEEADSYSMVISQGAKAVEWSSFETDSE